MKSTIIIFFIIIVLLIFEAHSLSAKDYLSLSDLSLDELQHVKFNVSIASSFVENRLTAGSTVSVITRDDWHKRGDRTTADALKHMPGSQVYSTVYGAENLSIRGYSKLSVRGLAVMVDGIPLNSLVFGNASFWTSDIQLGVLEKIEVIRGPGSALYGTDAFHGVVGMKLFESVKNSFETFGEAGDHGHKEGGFRLSRVVSDNVIVNAAVSHGGIGTQDRPYKYSDYGTGESGTGNYDMSYETTTAFLKLFNNPDSGWFYGTSFLLNWHREPDGVGQAYFFDKRLRTDGITGLADNDRSGISASDIALGSVSLGYKFADNSKIELKAYRWQNDAKVYQNDINTFNEQDVLSTSINSTKEYRQDFSLHYQTNLDSVNTLVAVSAAHEDRKITDQNPRVVYGNDTVYWSPTYEGFVQRVDSLVVEAKTSFFDEQFLLLYGGRFDDYSTFGHQTTPRLGLIYHPDENSAIKLLYGNAYRAPVASELQSAGTVRGSSKIKPETLDSYELIFMRQSKKWQAELIFFYSKWDEAIRPTVDESGFHYINSGKNSSKGVEMSLGFNKNNWSGNLNASYVKSQNKSNDFDYTAFPKWIVNAEAGHNWEEYGIRFNLIMRYFTGAKIGDETLSQTSLDENPDYLRFDLHIEKTISNKINIWLDILNILDRDNAIPSLWNADSPVPDTGITGSLGVSYKF
jgi:outer membrane receptor for ferrienterochelin and colicin